MENGLNEYRRHGWATFLVLLFIAVYAYANEKCHEAMKTRFGVAPKMQTMFMRPVNEVASLPQWIYIQLPCCHFTLSKVNGEDGPNWVLKKTWSLTLSASGSPIDWYARGLKQASCSRHNTSEMTLEDLPPKYRRLVQASLLHSNVSLRKDYDRRLIVSSPPRNLRPSSNVVAAPPLLHNLSFMTVISARKARATIAHLRDLAYQNTDCDPSDGAYLETLHMKAPRRKQSDAMTMG
ncbi:hypothetical protein BC939DRAFT_181780 [Gamsiella multidivaricata]|uniref:uncharacterized protein n=1 Tax=Gamsiella multidivaricata TaxID=101098 RepID=UPI00221F2F2F|nr:uncharacterized protein BC939DRAFT_181780 [Gamsiella multidivaricata]KAI7822329.1 hypothetical protein BC939DRAFT_181780 [Gamsiella multidivaricata]